MLKNKIICLLKKIWYRFYETIRLKYERWQYDEGDENPLITVYTPTYNRCNLLMKRALPSVLAQTYRNFEYIVVGDGCSDSTEDVVKCINDSRIKFYNIKRKRPDHNYDSTKDWFLSATYPANFALKKARGQYIAKIDDDDIWHPNHLENMLSYIQRTPFEFITSSYEEERNNKKTINRGVVLSNYLKLKKKWNDTLLGAHSSWFYKSYLRFMKYNPAAWRKRWNRVDDTDLLERMYKIGVNMGFFNKVLTYVYQRPNESSIGLEAVRNKEELR